MHRVWVAVEVLSLWSTSSTTTRVPLQIIVLTASTAIVWLVVIRTWTLVSTIVLVLMIDVATSVCAIAASIRRWLIVMMRRGVALLMVVVISIRIRWGLMRRIAILSVWW